MKVNRILVWGTGLVFILLVAGGAYLSLYLDRYKGLLESGISGVLGREVRIEKGVTLHWSMTPSIALQGLWIGNPDWAKGAYLARAEKVLLRVSIGGLLKRRLEVKQVTVQNADVALEAAADGRRNWAFGEESGDGLGVLPDALKLENSRLSYRSPAGVDYRADIAGITFDGLDEKQLALDARFTYRGVAFSASATATPPVIPGSGNRAFKGQVDMLGATLSVSGELVGTSGFTSLDVAMQSERLDLQKSLSPLWPSMPLAGSVRQIAGRFTTAGDTLQSLAGNLSGELKIASADLTRPAYKGAEANSIAFKALRLKVAPRQPVSLQSGLVYAKQTYQLELAGGLLADLFEEKKSWKSLKVNIKARLGKKPIQITGDVGPLSALHAGRDLKAKLSVLQDDLKVQLDGTFASLAEVKGSRFAIDASGPSLSRLNPLLGLMMPDTPSFTVTAQIEGGERHLLVKKLKVTSGKSDIGGRLSIPLAQGERIEGTLTSRALHLQTFLEHSDKPAGDDQPFLERELSTGALQGLDGSVRLKVGHLHLNALELEQVGVEADLEKGHLKLIMGAENERMTADVDLKPVGTEWRVALNHKGKIDLGELIDRNRHGDDESQAPLDLELHLKGTGKSPAAMLQSVEGQFLMVIGEGKLSETIARHLPLGSVFYTLVGTLLPEDQNKQPGKLECAAVQLDIAKGIATSSKGLALRTDQINILGGGALNLQTGEIDLRFKTAQRKGIGISILGVADGLVGVTGTLQDPAVSLNVGRAIAYGAAAWATAGLSVLADSIFTRVTAFSNPCEAVLQAGRESQAGK